MNSVKNDLSVNSVVETLLLMEERPLSVSTVAANAS